MLLLGSGKVLRSKRGCVSFLVEIENTDMPSHPWEVGRNLLRGVSQLMIVYFPETARNGFCRMEFHFSEVANGFYPGR